MCSEYTIDFSFVRERHPAVTVRVHDNRCCKFCETYFYKEMDATRVKYLRKKKEIMTPSSLNMEENGAR